MWFLVGKQLSRIEVQNQQIEDGLVEFRKRKVEFLARKVKADAERARLENNGIKLVQLMQREAEGQAISIQKFNKDTRFLTTRHRNLKEMKTILPRKCAIWLKNHKRVTTQKDFTGSAGALHG